MDITAARFQEQRRQLAR